MNLITGAAILFLAICSAAALEYQYQHLVRLEDNPDKVYEDGTVAQQFALPPLPYAYDALEPFIDAKTMNIHHTSHHEAYTQKLNIALYNVSKELKYNMHIDEILKNLDSLPQEIRQSVRNNGGGYINHALFWRFMESPSTASIEKISPELRRALEENFGSVEKFQLRFVETGHKLFGSGWVWAYVRANNGSIAISSYPNQDSPILHGDYPILGLDLWEHAYYLSYQDKRTLYSDSWLSLVNWEFVSNEYQRFTAHFEKRDEL